MSKENAERFFKLIAEDNVIRVKYENILGKYRDTGKEGEERSALVKKDILDIASQVGCEFTFEEMNLFSQEVLSEEELQSVIGGVKTETKRGTCPKNYKFRSIMCIQTDCNKIGDCPISQFYY